LPIKASWAAAYVAAEAAAPCWLAAAAVPARIADQAGVAELTKLSQEAKQALALKRSATLNRSAGATISALNGQGCASIGIGSWLNGLLLLERLLIAYTAAPAGW